MPRRRQACMAPKTLLKHGLVPTTKRSTQAFLARPSSMARPTIDLFNVIGRAAGAKSFSSVQGEGLLITQNGLHPCHEISFGRAEFHEAPMLERARTRKDGDSW